MGTAAKVETGGEEASSRARKELLGGLLEAFPVSELLEFFSELRKRGLLLLENWEGRTASCKVASGVIYDVECGQLSGAEALTAFAWWSEGAFSFLAIADEQAEGLTYRVSEVLMDAVRIADELERRAGFLPKRTEELSLTSGAQAPRDELDCGVDEVFARLAANPRVTLSDLESSVELAPIKIRLSVAALAEAGLLGAWRATASRPLPAIGDDWWLRTLARHPGGLRVLVVCPSVGSPDDLGQAVSPVCRSLGMTGPSLSYASGGPSFARIRPKSGGILSLAFLPLVAKNRHLLRTFVRSVELVLFYLDASRRSELEDWRIAVPSSVLSVPLDPREPLGVEIERHLRSVVGAPG